MTTEDCAGGTDKHGPDSIEQEHAPIDPAIEAFAMLWRAASARASRAKSSGRATPALNCTKLIS